MKSTTPYRHQMADLALALDIKVYRANFLKAQAQDFINKFNELGELARHSEAIEFSEKVARNRREMLYLNTLLIEAITKESVRLEILKASLNN